MELAKQMFTGYQALVVTHTDGHNKSGNIHTHIEINSVRKYAVDRQPYMDKPHEERAGYKHRSTDKFIKFFKKAVMDRCQQEGLHQIGRNSFLYAPGSVRQAAVAADLDEFHPFFLRSTFALHC